MNPKNSWPAAAQRPCPPPSGNPYHPTGITFVNHKDSRPNDIPEIDNRKLAAIERGEPYESCEPDYKPDPYVGAPIPRGLYGMYPRSPSPASFDPERCSPRPVPYTRTSPCPIPGAPGYPDTKYPVPLCIIKCPVVVRQNFLGEIQKGTFITNNYGLRNESPQAELFRLFKDQGLTLIWAGEAEKVTAYFNNEDGIRVPGVPCAGYTFPGFLLVEKTWSDTSGRASL